MIATICADAGPGRSLSEAAFAALRRRSIRAYSSRDVSDVQLRTLLELTGRAPSAFNAQPWRFVVVRDAALRQALQRVAFDQRQVGGAPVVIAMYSDMEATLANVEAIVHPGLDAERRARTIASLRRTWGEMTPHARGQWGNAQANIALGYLLLLAEAEGLATSPMLGFDADGVKSLLGIPQSAVMTALVAIGHAAEDGAPSYRLGVDVTSTFR